MVFPINSQSGGYSFSLISIDPGLLSLSYQAQLNVSSAASSTESRLYSAFKGLDSAVTAPWQIATEPQTLARRIRDVQGLEKFIDLDSVDVKRSALNVDGQAMFALYNALTALQTLAQYAAEKNTPLASLSRLNTKFQEGFAEVQDYVSSVNLNLLTLTLGDKEDDATTAFGLGKNGATVAGDVIQTAQRGDALAGVAGDEIFTVRIEKNDAYDDITVDLSQISGTLNIDAVVNLINQEIAALTILDGEGNPASKYQTTFSVQHDSDFDYFMQIDGSATETVTLIPQTAEPVLYVTGAFTKTTGDGSTAATLTTISGVDTATPLHTLASDISGTDLLATEIAEEAAKLEAEGEEVDTPDPTTIDSTTGGIAVDSVGNLYVVGASQGSFDGQINTASGNDVFLTKMDSNGEVIYSRLLGAEDDASAYNITIDSSDNVIITGQTTSDLSGDDVLASTDMFVTKFNSRGDKIFTAQLDTIATTAGLSVAVDSNGDIFVGGYTDGAISATSGFGGDRDALVMKLDGTDGTVLDSTLIGGTGYEEVKGIEIASDGGILVVTTETGNGYLRKLDAADLSSETYNVALGALVGGTIGGIVVDGTAVYVTGSTGDSGFTGGGTATNTHSGGIDGFVTRIDDAGASATVDFTTFVGGTGSDAINDVTINGGSIYVTGQTDGSISGTTETGFQDAFVAKIDGTTGTIDFVDQFGQSLTSGSGTGIAFSATGRSVLDALGLKTGVAREEETLDIVTQTSVKDGDFFYITVNDGAKRRISIEDGDTYETLATKISLVSLRYLESEEFDGEDGPKLRIKAINGGRLELFAGDGDRDALAKLGIEAGKLAAADLLFNLDASKDGYDPSDLGGIFGLSLSTGLHVLDKTTARYTLSKLDTAISTIQRAYRSLFFDPVRAASIENGRFEGTVPAYLTARIANFQDALTRLQGASYGYNLGLII